MRKGERETDGYRDRDTDTETETEMECWKYFSRPQSSR